MCYVHNQWYDISWATLYFFWYKSYPFLMPLNDFLICILIQSGLSAHSLYELICFKLSRNSNEILERK